jgi:predicted PhzF superfamily epimerase YddE/YHI9
MHVAPLAPASLLFSLALPQAKRLAVENHEAAAKQQATAGGAAQLPAVSLYVANADDEAALEAVNAQQLAFAKLNQPAGELVPFVWACAACNFTLNAREHYHCQAPKCGAWEDGARGSTCGTARARICRLRKQLKRERDSPAPAAGGS